MTLKIGLLGATDLHTLRLAKVLKNCGDKEVLFVPYYPVFMKVKSEKFLRNFKQYSTIEPFSILNPFSFVKAFKKLSKDVDILIIASLHPLLLIYLLLMPRTRPVIYIPFGGDWKRWKILVRYVLSFFSKIFVEFHLVKKQIHNIYNVPPSKFKRVIIWPLEDSFDPSKCNTKVVSRSELKHLTKITRNWIIFSPRALLPVYNHHIILQSLSLLPPEVVSNVEVVLIDFTTFNSKYKEKIRKLAEQLNIKVNIYPGPLSANRMRELYQVSDISVNIPKSDQFGASIMEAALCGSPLILNQEIKTYHEKFTHNKDCIFVKPTPEHLARAIEILLLEPKIRKKISHRAKRLFLERVNWKKVGENLFKSIIEVVLTFKEQSGTK